ncbi:hypothetical protein JHD48_05015 [Sulfurimonas sp. SAG-AH-194-I05]|nr:hypothetical protein [Sulfurimonas sp. SAG-AH-194-I05]MDF1875086.1 hypothetical protein [Sulfurimonas sp. SAG-AH-194-I05]
MNKILFSVVAALTIATTTVFAGANNLPIEKVKRGISSHIIAIFDRGGLNNYSCLPLYKRNINQYEKLFTKRTMKKIRVKSMTFLTFDEIIHNIGTVSDRRPNRVYRDAQELFSNTKNHMQYDTKGLAKDVLGVFRYSLMLSKQFDTNDKVIIVLFSNLRDSVRTKNQLKAMENIKLPKNVSLRIYASSGIASCLAKTTASQGLQVYTRTPFVHPTHHYLASARINTWPPHASYK